MTGNIFVFEIEIWESESCTAADTTKAASVADVEAAP